MRRSSDRFHAHAAVALGLALLLALAGCSGGGSGGDSSDPALDVADAGVDEGDAGGVLLAFTVTLSEAADAEVRVDWSTTGGSATAGADFVGAAGQLVFPIGTTTRTFDVAVSGDTLDEADETFTVSLANATGGARIGDGSATGTIRDDDPLPALAVDDVALEEGDAGTTRFDFTLTLAPASGRTVSVAWTTTNGSAAAGSDYAAASGTASFAPGQTSRTLSVDVNGDALVELDETFTLALNTPANATLADASGLGTILNDDAGGGALGLDARPANATCVAPARPSGGPNVDVIDAFPGAPIFSAPTKLLQAPNDPDRWFVLEKAGRVKVLDVADPAAAQTWLDLRAGIDSAGEGGLLGLAFHPDWPTTLEVYVSYTADGSPQTSRVSRLLLDDATSPSPPTEQILLQVDQPFDNHDGGDIAFDAEGRLYLGLGDGGSAGDPGNRAQNPTRLLGKMLRIEVLGVAFPSPGYTIPADNPYAANPKCGPGTNAQACPEIFASGLRNPWRWSFDAPTGALWLGDVGQNAYEEVDLVTLGGNYGWNCREGFAAYPGTGDCSGAFIDPVIDYDHSEGFAITGGYVYRGSAIPTLAGRYVFGDYVSGRVWALRPDGSGGYEKELLIGPGENISAFALGADGELYLIVYPDGRIRKLVPAAGGSPADPIPTDLVDTGCVDPLDPSQPASGLVPYAIRAPFWSDGAAKERHLALPDGATIDVGALSGDAGGDFSFPNGTVLMKHFRLAGQLIETRLLMRHPDGVWAGYTWEWNDAGTAATRVIGGKLREVQGQTWIYPSEGACLQCHTAAAGHALGPEIAQLNDVFLYPQTGRTANQLDTYDGIGLLSAPLPAPSASLPVLADPGDAGAPLAERARAWLHTNCAQCHRPGGPTPSSMDLRFSTALSATNACDAAPQSGSFGLTDARLIAPGDAARSVVVYRASRRDASGMPPLGSNAVDAAGVAVVTDWIESLGGCN